jgi:hypothetical protein
MSHHANLHALCRSYCETFGVEAAWLDQDDGTAAVRMDQHGVRITFTQNRRRRPESAYAFIEYAELDEGAEAEVLPLLMYTNLMLPAGEHMRYGLHPLNRRIVFQMVLDIDAHDAYSLRELLERQILAARLWRGEVQ